MKKIPERTDVDFETFHTEIVAAEKPAVIRSLVGNWTAVRRSQESVTAICEYLGDLDIGKPVYTIAAPPEAGGRFFYSDDLKSVNFNKGQIPLAQVLQQLIAQSDEDDGHAIAVQALSVRECLPSFEAQNALDFLAPETPPTMWIGTRGQVAPHYDVHRNLACVVAGQRRFVLFPPEQVANLYPGPFLNAPGGVPVSLVDPWDPDLDRYPLFAAALDVAQEAVLGPGDALYIPSLWWHGVASLERINVLVNYWWGGIAPRGLSANDSLMHAMLTIANLDEAQRQAWRAFFDYFVFRRASDPRAHLPAAIEDITTSLEPASERAVRELLSDRLKTDQ